MGRSEAGKHGLADIGDNAICQRAPSGTEDYILPQDTGRILRCYGYPLHRASEEICRKPPLLRDRLAGKAEPAARCQFLSICIKPPPLNKQLPIEDTCSWSANPVTLPQGVVIVVSVVLAGVINCAFTWYAEGVCPRMITAIIKPGW